MSAYQMVVGSIHRRFDLSRFKARFWKWWLALYAEPPRRFLPYL